mmetsp:Transcript_69241/g.158865  ORF Transcript_69241/g.158865 Transcript_69241/m.158865 type:complete len:208 (-) Transcript_69241:34-657(-)
MMIFAACKELLYRSGGFNDSWEYVAFPGMPVAPRPPDTSATDCSCRRVLMTQMGLMSVTVAVPAVTADRRCVGDVFPNFGSMAFLTALYVEKYTARAGTTPASIGPIPFQNPPIPSFFTMSEHICMAVRLYWHRDCSRVFTTSSGHVMLAPITPPIPPATKCRHGLESLITSCVAVWTTGGGRWDGIGESDVKLVSVRCPPPSVFFP